MNTSLGFNISGILCFFAATIVLASPIFRKWAASEFIYEHSGRQHKLWGFLFGIKNRNDALNQFLVTLDRKKDKKLKDTNAHIRGFLWATLGLIFSVLATVLS